MVRFVIENMNCGGCAKGVTATVRAVDPLAQVEVDLDRKAVTVIGGRVDGTALTQTLQAAGWKAEHSIA